MYHVVLSSNTLHRLPIYESADAFTNVFSQMVGMGAKEKAIGRRRENMVGVNLVLAEYHDEHLYHDIYDNHA